MSNEKPKTLEGLTAWLESPEGQASIEDTVREYAEREEKNKAFFESDEFFSTLEIIKRDLGSNSGFLDEENFRYRPEEFETDINDLMQVFNSIDASDLKQSVDEAISFENFYYDYDGMRFKWMFGQGCAMMIEKL